MTKRTMGLVLVWLVLAVPASLDAQGIGGRLRKRAQEALGGEKKTEQTETDRAKIFTGDVIEISEAGVRGLQNGLDTELRLLTEFTAHLDTYRSPEEFESCEQEVPASPEGMEIMGSIGRLPETATVEDIQRAVEKMEKDMIALKKKRCGPSIIEDWPQSQRAERLKEIGMKAAAAAGPVHSSAPAPQRGPSAEDDWAIPVTLQEGLPYQVYQIMKERIDALCKFIDLGNEVPPEARVEFSASLIDSSASAKNFWVFMPDEVKAIKPLCPKVTLTIGEITIITEKATSIKTRR